jgi:hypothetical protein
MVSTSAIISTTTPVMAVVSVIINVGVNLEPAEETFDAVKEVNEFVSARAGILSRL